MAKIISIKQSGSICVFVGGRPFTVPSDHGRYADLEAAIAADDVDTVTDIVTTTERITKLIGNYGDVTVYAGHITFQGRPLDNFVVERILKLMADGHDPAPYGLFLDRVMRNPSQRAATELFDWLQKARIPLAPDGRILAFKNIRGDYTDIHSGKFDNSPGTEVSMPREEVDDNSARECSKGLHFCAASYLPTFTNSGSGERGGKTRTVVVLIDPADVVAFPKDYNGAKGRTWRYQVLFELDSIQDATKFFSPDQPVFDFAAYLKPAVDAAPAKKLPEGVEIKSMSFEDRLIRLEQQLAIHPTEVLFSDRLTRIEKELGLADSAPPQIARLERAEAAAFAKKA